MWCRLQIAGSWKLSKLDAPMHPCYSWQMGALSSIAVCLVSVQDVERGFAAWRASPGSLVGYHSRLLEGHPLQYRHVTLTSVVPQELGLTVSCTEGSFHAWD